MAENDKAAVKSGRQEEIDFKIFSNAVTPTDGDDAIIALASGETGTRPQVRGIGSSNCVDLAGDIITKDALQDIRDKMGVNTAVCLNHSYDAPEDIFAGLAEQPRLVTMKSSHHGLLRPDAEYAAVELVANVNRANPRAIQAYKTIAEEGIQLGFSLGFNITDYEMIKDKSGSPTGFKIQHVDPLEESLVTIPCNQQSWVTAAGQSIETKSITFDMVNKGFVTYVTPPYETTDTNWAAAATKGLFKRFGVKGKVDRETDLIYLLKHYRDWDEVTAAYLYQMQITLNRWGLGIGKLPES